MRGEIWSMAGGGQYASKPRPVVIIQDDAFDATDSVTVCGFTSDPTEAPLFRLLVLPTDENGLRRPSRIMVDKINTVRRTGIGERIGRLAESDVRRLNAAIAVFVGLATPASEPVPPGR